MGGMGPLDPPSCEGSRRSMEDPDLIFVLKKVFKNPQDGRIEGYFVINNSCQ